MTRLSLVQAICASLAALLLNTHSAQAEVARIALPPALGPQSSPDASLTADALSICERAKRLGPKGILLLDKSERQKLAYAIASDASASSIGYLWLLAHDPDGEVQAAALVGALGRCPNESTVVCSAMMTFFISDAETQTAWTARSALLAAAPEAAMSAAQRAYKLEVLSIIAGRVGLSQLAQGHLRALDLLAQDPDPEVQQMAGMVMLELSR